MANVQASQPFARRFLSFCGDAVHTVAARTRKNRRVGSNYLARWAGGRLVGGER